MNHYHVLGHKCLFVAMVKDGVYIKAEGPSSELVFIDLKRQANQLLANGQSDAAE